MSNAKKSLEGVQGGTEEVDCHVVTRPDLADPSFARKSVVLLTGAWPHDAAGSVIELDNVIDRRFIWLDQEAERLAELASGDLFTDPTHGLSAPWINVLALRYYLLKLLRVIEFFSQIQPPKKGDRLSVAASRADRDDVAIVTAICSRAGAHCHIDWRDDAVATVTPSAEKEEWWRRSLRRLSSQLSAAREGHTSQPRVVLCGNPRFLDPLCRVLHERHCHLWWLYDRFAVKPFLQWSRKGVDQLTCQQDLCSADQREPEPLDLPRLDFRGMDLRSWVADWLEARLVTRRHDQRRWQQRIDDHFRNIQPDLLVMDEDATPMKRIAMVAARRYGGESHVVQHGAPVARFGFAPLGADGIFVWGRSTQEQLQQWHVPKDRIFVTGSPTHDTLYRALRQRRRRNPRSGTARRILLLATVPPRDDRPDLIEMNLNSRTYGEMIEAAFAAVESIPNATLVVKPHPRTQKDPAVQAAVSRHPNLQIEMSRSHSLVQSLHDVDCVLSCLSSAGIEATLAGVPVVQLLPRGAGRILPHDRWGMLGSASNAKELIPLIGAARQEPGRSTNKALGNVFANDFPRQGASADVSDAANRIADHLLDRIATKDRSKQSSMMSRTNSEQGRSKTVTSG